MHKINKRTIPLKSQFRFQSSLIYLKLRRNHTQKLRGYINSAKCYAGFLGVWSHHISFLAKNIKVQIEQGMPDHILKFDMLHYFLTTEKMQFWSADINFNLYTFFYKNVANNKLFSQLLKSVITYSAYPTDRKSDHTLKIGNPWRKKNMKTKNRSPTFPLFTKDNLWSCTRKHVSSR